LREKLLFYFAFTVFSGWRAELSASLRYGFSYCSHTRKNKESRIIKRTSCEKLFANDVISPQKKRGGKGSYRAWLKVTVGAGAGRGRAGSLREDCLKANTRIFLDVRPWRLDVNCQRTLSPSRTNSSLVTRTKVTIYVLTKLQDLL